MCSMATVRASCPAASSLGRTMAMCASRARVSQVGSQTARARSLASRYGRTRVYSWRGFARTEASEERRRGYSQRQRNLLVREEAVRMARCRLRSSCSGSRPRHSSAWRTLARLALGRTCSGCALNASMRLCSSTGSMSSLVAGLRWPCWRGCWATKAVRPSNRLARSS